MSREKNEDLASCLEKWLAEDEAMTLDDLAALEKGASDAPWHSFGNTLYLRKMSPENPGTQNMDFFWMPGNSETARFIAAMRNHARALIDVARAAKVYLNAFDGDNGPSIFEHEACESLRLKLKELGL